MNLPLSKNGIYAEALTALSGAPLGAVLIAEVSAYLTRAQHTGALQREHVQSLGRYLMAADTEAVKPGCALYFVRAGQEFPGPLSESLVEPEQVEGLHLVIRSDVTGTQGFTRSIPAEDLLPITVQWVEAVAYTPAGVDNSRRQVITLSLEGRWTVAHNVGPNEACYMVTQQR